MITEAEVLPSSKSPRVLRSVKRFSCIWPSAYQGAQKPNNCASVYIHRPCTWFVLPMLRKIGLLPWGNQVRQGLNEVWPYAHKSQRKASVLLILASDSKCRLEAQGEGGRWREK